MRIVLVYNPYNSAEVAALGQVKEELSTYAEDVQVYDFQQVKDRYFISRTPAVIFIREDLQGEQLLNVDEVQARLRVTLEAYKNMDEEEKNLHDMENSRLDYRVNAEIKRNVDPIGSELIQSKLDAKKTSNTCATLGKQLIQARLDLAKLQGEGDAA
ncbi:hypothetical protein [Paenibacillus macerans]|uniref:hypothetical protein n=1 Tax=Paenibacillus macerans TaxID=44252 RepID=UPI003D31E326